MAVVLRKKRVMSYGDYPDDTYTGISDGDYHKNVSFALMV